MPHSPPPVTTDNINIISHALANDTLLEDTLLPPLPALYQAHERSIIHRQPNFEELRPKFAWLPADVVKRTFDCTTQFATIPMSTTLKKQFKTPHPAANIPRRDEPLATDTVFSDTPAIDSGATIAQIYVGTESLVGAAYPMKREKEFPNTLQDEIRARGAPTKLITDSASVEMSWKVLDILRYLCIGAWQSEAHHQHQNPFRASLPDHQESNKQTHGSHWLPCQHLAPCFVVCHLCPQLHRLLLPWLGHSHASPQRLHSRHQPSPPLPLLGTGLTTAMRIHPSHPVPLRSAVALLALLRMLDI